MVVRIREACARLGVFELKDYELYSSCEPCPMCLGAIYWSRLARISFANFTADAAKIGFDDCFIHRQLAKPVSERTIRRCANRRSRPYMPGRTEGTRFPTEGVASQAVGQAATVLRH